MTKTILVVDDEEDIRRLAQISLTRVGGHEVLTAASGAECLRVLEERRTDAVLLDVMMPVLDGTETLARIRAGAKTHDIPVVFMTAGVVESDMARLRTLAISGVLNKPFDPLTLPHQLGEVLGWVEP
ncbi:MAG: response regulator [Actinomycetales bacterium]|nr:response regulator [Actinomycetales bacterium]